MTRRRRWWLAAVAVGAALVATALPTERLRHLALPIASDPSVRPTVAARAIDDALVSASVTARVPGRVSAILPIEGAVFVATFDEGVYRCIADTCTPVGALEGRERFVDALAEWNGAVVAATHRGAILFSHGGARGGVLAAGQAISSLALAGDDLVLGTARGLWSARSDGLLGERGPEGESLRVTALAANGATLWIGTPDGVYSLTGTSKRAAWHPLVFGAPAASTNVVTALVALGDGVLAGTDDGGLVYVDADGVHAAPFADATANGVNPGALARVANIAVVGTAGGGLIGTELIDSGIDSTPAPRGRRLASGNVCAVTVADGALWFGRDDGRVYAVAASRIFWMSAS